MAEGFRPEYVWETVKCRICGKEFLVERLLYGVDHTGDIFVTCKECLKKEGISREFRKEFPEEAKRIEKWLKEDKVTGEEKERL